MLGTFYILIKSRGPSVFLSGVRPRPCVQHQTVRDESRLVSTPDLHPSRQHYSDLDLFVIFMHYILSIYLSFLKCICAKKTEHRA